MKIMLFGANGRLGSALSADLLKSNMAEAIVQVTREDVDLREPYDITAAIHSSKPDLVINCAAKNGLESCDDGKIEAAMVNAIAPLAMATATKNIGAAFLHFSTDYAQVARGNEGSAPWRFYGLTKQTGEVNAIAANPCTTVFRLSSLYGPDLGGSLDCIKQYNRGRGAPEDPIQVLRQWTTPTSVRAVSNFIVKHYLPKIALAPAGWSGIHPLNSRGPMYKSDFARLALSFFLGVTDARIIEGELPIPRPEFCVMNTDAFDNMWATSKAGVKLAVMPSVVDDLIDCAAAWGYSSEKDEAKPALDLGKPN